MALAPPLRVTIAAARTLSLRDFCLFDRGCEGSALAPPSKNKIGIPRSSLPAVAADRAVPPADFLLAPPHPVSPTGKGSCADFAQNPVTKGKRP